MSEFYIKKVANGFIIKLEMPVLEDEAARPSSMQDHMQEMQRAMFGWKTETKTKERIMVFLSIEQVCNCLTMYYKARPKEEEKS